MPANAPAVESGRSASPAAAAPGGRAPNEAKDDGPAEGDEGGEGDRLAGDAAAGGGAAAAEGGEGDELDDVIRDPVTLEVAARARRRSAGRRHAPLSSAASNSKARLLRAGGIMDCKRLQSGGRHVTTGDRTSPKRP